MRTTSPPIYVHIVLAEAAAYHAKTLESRADDYTTNVRLRLEMGRYILAEDYVRALRGRDLLRTRSRRGARGRDALLLPRWPCPATRLGAATVRVGGSDEPVRNITLRLTQLFNVTGHPAISVPCGKTTDGLPIGAQLVGDADARAARTARALEPYFGPGNVSIRMRLRVLRDAACGGISGGGAGLMSGDGVSTISGAPGGRGTSGFLGCSIIGLSGQCNKHVVHRKPSRSAASLCLGLMCLELDDRALLPRLGASSRVRHHGSRRPSVRLGRRLADAERPRPGRATHDDRASSAGSRR